MPDTVDPHHISPPPGTVVVTMPAEADYATAPAIRRGIADALAASPTTLILDFTPTQFCDSAGLREVILAHRHARTGHITLRLAVPPDRTRVFAITGLTGIVPIYPSLDAALAGAPPPVTQQPAHP